MIKANHKKYARLLYNIYIGRILRNNFSAFYLINELPEIDKKQALLITPNHISWWDGFFIDFITRPRINRKIHLMMLEAELEKIKFFTKVGAFSINPGNRKSIIETRDYLKEITDNTGNFAVIYPQGEIEPFEKPKLSVKNGLAFFANSLKPDTIILPMAFKTQFYNKKHPAILSRAGKPLPASIVASEYEYYVKEFQLNVDLLNKYIFSNPEPENNLF